MTMTPEKRAFTTHVIHALYQLTTGRDADEAGFSHWFGKIERREITLQDLMDRFLDSDEAGRAGLKHVTDGDGNILFPGTMIWATAGGERKLHAVARVSDTTVHIAPLPGNMVAIGDDRVFDGAELFKHS
ncbi:MAG: DUF4214 domain-containing protein [Pseudomonadota bacterium]